MSLITRCPSCATMFKVVPDQLRISDGWVRCGHCGEVFDAADHLQDESQPAVAAFASGGQQLAPPAGAPRPTAAAPMSAPGTAPMADLAPPMGSADLSSDTLGSTAAASSAQAGAGDGLSGSEPVDPQATAWQPFPSAAENQPVPEPMPWETSANPHLEHDEILGIPLPPVPPGQGEDAEPTLPLPLPSAAPAPLDPAVDPVDEFMQEAIAGLPSSGLEPLSVDSLQPAPPSIEQELAAWTADRRPSVDDFASAPAPLETRPQDLQFVREAQRKAFWRRPLVRAGLWLTGLVLASVLAAQWAVHDRDRIAAFEPRARPVLEWLCSFSGCRIAAFKQIESISIDSSSFSKTRDNLYLLNVVIKNSARIELAMPSLELTLTDSQDQPLLRRVLTPAELGAPPLLAASGDWSAALPVSVAINGIASRVAGYRVLAFYP